MNAPEPARTTPLSHATTATLVALCAEEEIAKRIETQLRNSGHAVRVGWVNDLEDFEDVLKRGKPDLVLCSLDLPNARANDVIRLCAREAPDLPAIFVASGEVTVEETTNALAAGARDLVGVGGPGQLKHLELVCVRELRGHYQRRELRETRGRLADFESRHKSLLEETADAVIHIQEGVITNVNAAFAALLGNDHPEELQGLPLMDVVSKAGQTVAKGFLKLVAGGKTPDNSQVELQLKKEDGDPLNVTAQVTLGEEDGERLVALLVRPEKPPQDESEPEPKTASQPAAPTRPNLLATLEGAISANVGMHRGLCVVMVDSFASIEQRLGYQESESVLDQVGALVEQRLSKNESLHRSSTALFSIVLSRPNQDEFMRFAELVREDIAAQLFKTRDHETHLTATLICHPVSESDKATEVIDHTVSEARKASRGGGNQTATTGKTAEDAKVAQEDKAKANRVKKALMENRMRLAYQSIASLAGDDKQHFDVLVRMLDESGHEVPARDFIPAAERHGIIVAVDRWVIGRTLAVLSKRQNTPDQSAMFVRISEQTLREGEGFLKWLSEQTKARPIRKGSLVVAINEAVAETHVSKAKALCQALNAAGIAVALDHYGVGSKPQQVLEHIPAEFVRFDYKFSKQFDDEKLQVTLGELMKHANDLGKKTIMGQVENASAMARLWQLGVKYIQGYHIQAPEAVLMSADLKA